MARAKYFTASRPTDCWTALTLSISPAERFARKENSHVETIAPRENNEHPTSNTERRIERGFALPFDLRRSMFDVGCSSGFMGRGIPFSRAGKSNQRVNRSEALARFSTHEPSLGARLVPGRSGSDSLLVPEPSPSRRLHSDPLRAGTSRAPDAGGFRGARRDKSSERSLLGRRGLG